MTFRRVIVSLAAVWALSACSNDDTIVALNVSATDAVPVVDQLHVTFTQGSRRHVYDFAPPTETPGGDDPPPASIQNSFFERITLPDGWDEKSTLITVEAQQADGSPFDPPLGDETTVTMEANGVVAAYIRLDIPAEPPSSLTARITGTPTLNSPGEDTTSRFAGWAVSRESGMLSPSQ